MSFGYHSCTMGPAVITGFEVFFRCFHFSYRSFHDFSPAAAMRWLAALFLCDSKNDRITDKARHLRH